jgi:hypothetical protein
MFFQVSFVITYKIKLYWATNVAFVFVGVGFKWRKYVEGVWEQSDDDDDDDDDVDDDNICTLAVAVDERLKEIKRLIHNLYISCTMGIY